MASPCPIEAAMRVALTNPSLLARSARSTRPPSIGKAGMRLKTSRITFITSRATDQRGVGQVVRGGRDGLPGQHQPSVEDRRENQGDEWSRKGDQQFFPGLVGDPLQPRHSSDRQEDHIRSPDPESPGHEDVPEFMKDDAGKQERRRTVAWTAPGVPPSW